MYTSRLFAAIIVTALTSAAWVAADSVAKPERGIVIGQAVELSTHAMNPEGDLTEAMRARCEQGFPVGIIEEDTGELWVCVYRSSAPASPLETANAELLPLMGKKVAAQGLKFRKDGINVLRLSVVSEY